jgi:ribosomal protein L16 Arg81 hydroxylase
VHENEVICKRLAETSSVDTDVELTDERASTTQAIQKLKSQSNSQIQTALEDACMRLEQLSQKVQNEATTHRMQQTQAARESSEAGLNKIREAMQEAFSAIQSAREQNME